MRPVAKIEEARLIVAARVRHVDGCEKGVFNFVFVAARDAEVRKQEARLRPDARAIVLKAAFANEIAEFWRGDRCGIGLWAEHASIGGIKALNWILVVLIRIRFAAADFVAPVFAHRKIPARIGTKQVLCVPLVEARRFEDGLSRDARDAVVVAQRKTELVGVADGVTEIAGERAIQEIVVRSLAVRLEVRRRTRIIERAEQSAQLRSAAARIEAAAFAVNAELRHARLATMREKLHHARNGIRAVNRAFRPANDFDFVDVVEREAREIDSAPGRVDRRAI